MNSYFKGFWYFIIFAIGVAIGAGATKVDAKDVSPYEPAAGVYCRVDGPLSPAVRYWGNYVQIRGLERNHDGGFFNPSALNFCNDITTTPDYFTNASALNQYHFIVE